MIGFEFEETMIRKLRDQLEKISGFCANPLPLRFGSIWWGFRTMPIGVPRPADHRFRIDGNHDSGMMPITRYGMMPIS
jgi:hypothetical protein